MLRGVSILFRYNGGSPITEEKMYVCDMLSYRIDSRSRGRYNTYLRIAMLGPLENSRTAQPISPSGASRVDLTLNGWSTVLIV